MKKLFLLLTLLLALTFVFVACGDEGGGDSSNPPSNSPTMYTVKWYDETGNLISSDSVEEGTVPQRSYAVTDTAEWDYTFEGWSETATGDVLSSIPACIKDATYYAKVSAVKQKYSVVFNSMGGSAVATQTVEYGDRAVEPDDPELDGYRFVGWSAVEDGSIAVDFNTTIVSNVEYFAIWNEIVDVKELLAILLNGYELNPFDYIPESMRIDYSANLVNSNQIINDYSSFTNVKSVTYGFGEQWNMVLENLNQSKLFFNVLSVVDGVATTSILAFNNYFDNNPSNTAFYEFESGIYNVVIDFDGETLYYVLDYTAEIPVLGEQTVQIALSMDIDTSEKVVRIQLGDANALTYKIFENSYEFAIKYLGVRRALFSIERDNEGNVTGKIYEHITVSSIDYSSASEFYINEDYVSVVGNKASGLIGFKGCICELYDVGSGAMIGYEVQETLSSIEYNTLWFNLDDITGINSIKYVPKNGEIPARIYINGKSDVWDVKKVGGIGSKMFSRRFDIEFRKQYVYSFDSVKEEYVIHEIEVPMIFVQEENYDTFVSDVKAVNNVTISVDIANRDLGRLLNDYDTLIPDFVQHKDAVSSDTIINYIGDKIIF